MFPSSPEFAEYLDFPFYCAPEPCCNGHSPIRNTKSRYCKECSAEYQASNLPLYAKANGKRRAIKIKAQPEWANHEAIALIYKQASYVSLRTGVPHEVDHDIPLQGKYVCGLHVETNLKIIPMSENRKKSNLYDFA